GGRRVPTGRLAWVGVWSDRRSGGVLGAWLALRPPRSGRSPPSPGEGRWGSGGPASTGPSGRAGPRDSSAARPEAPGRAPTADADPAARRRGCDSRPPPERPTRRRSAGGDSARARLPHTGPPWVGPARAPAAASTP